MLQIVKPIPWKVKLCIINEVNCLYIGIHDKQCYIVVLFVHNANLAEIPFKSMIILF